MKDYLFDNVHNGVHLYSSITIEDQPHIPPNQPSALQHYDIVNKMLNEELAMGRIAGPFQTRPPGLIISPLAAVPKKDPGSYRIIHNLSFPLGNSVNSHTPRELCSVSYETIDDCIDIVTKLGKNCLISKIDVLKSFRIIRVAEYDLRFLGFMWNDSFWIDLVMPMGASISCSHFERLSTALQWIAINKLHVPYISHILDDFIFFGPPQSQVCKNSLLAFQSLADSVGIPLNPKKTVQPSTSVELHGILFDTVEMRLKVPQDKREKALKLIQQMKIKTKVTLDEIQKLTGLLQFLTKAIQPGRSFLRRLYDLTRTLYLPTHLVRLNAEAKRDLEAWEIFLKDFQGSLMLKSIDWHRDSHWKLFSDASGKGYGAMYGHKWIQGEFPPNWSKKSIAIRELVPVYLSFQLWVETFPNSKILLITLQ